MQVLIDMVFQVLLPGLLNGLVAIFHINSHNLLAKMIDIVVDFAALFFQLRSEVSIPPETRLNKKLLFWYFHASQSFKNYPYNTVFDIFTVKEYFLFLLLKQLLRDQSRFFWTNIQP